jgi:hypothetical protein
LANSPELKLTCELLLDISPADRVTSAISPAIPDGTPALWKFEMGHDYIKVTLERSF